MKILKHLKPKRIAFFSLLLLMVSCVYLDGIGYEDSLTAGDTATFTMDVRIEPAEDSSGEKMIISLLVPNSWNTETTSTVTYTSSIDEGTQSMSLVPENVLPSNGGGLSWAQHLKNTLGVGPNVLNDMKWVTFQSDNTYTLANNEDVTATVTIVTEVGPKNLKAKIGFFLNNSGDGLSTDTARWKVLYSDCIEVTGGTGLPVDYCELHYNVAQPLSATKNDLVTFKFQGDIEANDLVNEPEIHFCSTAYTTAGNQYEVCDYAPGSLMTRESEFSNTYQITLWPARYYNIPDNEQIDHIDYSFTNQDGTVQVTENDGSLFLFVFECN